MRLVLSLKDYCWLGNFDKMREEAWGPIQIRIDKVFGEKEEKEITIDELEQKISKQKGG